MRYTCAILTISDRGAKGERKDLSGPSVKELLKDQYEIKEMLILPDEEEIISEAIKKLTDKIGVDLVITTGGTGVTPRDVTPEATRKVIEKELPGFSEIMRVESYKITPHGIISRGVCGIRGKSLIINLPGSPKAAVECLSFIMPALDHTLSKLKGSEEECGQYPE